MNIDVHAHYWSEEYLDKVQALGKEDTHTQRGMGAGGGDELVKRLELMKRSDVDLQILLANPQMPYGSDERAAVEAAQFVNDEYAQVIAEHPDRFRAFAALPMPHIEASLAELTRALDELGFLGVGFNTTVLGRPLTPSEFEPIFEELNKRSGVAYIHPSGESAQSELIADHKTWLLGAPVEDTENLLTMIEKGYTQKYPNVSFIISHLGGAAPMLIQRWNNQIGWEAPGTPVKPSEAVRGMYFDSVGHGHIPALKASAESFGADRLLLGTDFPYESGKVFTRAVDFIKEGLSEEEAREVLSSNAAKLFGPLAD